MPVDIARLRATVEHLASFDRPSASDGERRAAEWIRGELEAQGVPARVEEEPAVGSMPLPLGLLSAAGIAAALGGPRAAPLGLLAAAGIVDDVSGGPHVFRRLLKHRTTWNVTGTAGDPDAQDTIVFVAHHDAANGGLIFRPELTRLVADAFPAWYERQHTSPQMMRLVAAGPALAAIGALTGVRALRRVGLMLAAGSTLAFADIGTRTVVPGANDNLTAVAVLLELARLLREQPVEGVRVLLVSTGSEESFMEGMRGWVRRHAPSLDRARTRVVVLETLGSPELILLEGEGMIWMSDYDP
jgi:acetylornithine deacetylase/succinyl-diaminopimelate desuccinylase-like protein